MYTLLKGLPNLGYINCKSKQIKKLMYQLSLSLILTVPTLLFSILCAVSQYLFVSIF